MLKTTGRPFKTITIGVKTVASGGREIEFSFKYYRDKWEFIANRQVERGDLPRKTWLGMKGGRREDLDWMSRQGVGVGG